MRLSNAWRHSRVSFLDLHQFPRNAPDQIQESHQTPREGKVPREAETHEIVMKSTQHWQKMQTTPYWCVNLPAPALQGHPAAEFGSYLLLSLLLIMLIIADPPCCFLLLLLLVSSCWSAVVG